MYVNATGMGALNCPGDPGCPGYLPPDVNAVVINPAGATDAQFASALAWFQNQAPTVSAAAPMYAGISGTTIAIAGASLFGFVILMKAVR